MKQQIPKLLLFVVAVLFVGNAYAHDVEIDGVYYNLNAEIQTASVTFKGTSYSSYSNEYTGEVVIPKLITYNGKEYSVTSIGDYAFSSCSGLTAINVSSNNTVYSSIDGILYNKETTTLITYPGVKPVPSVSLRP